ncbi:MAG: hypothetical protein H7062_23560 [Candidatus Saccharimonas sp.]|nr:hypothetical protein [Planctomycetaceae bacterium]
MPVAAVVTEYRQNCHADVIVGKILEGFDQKGGPGPALKLVGLYTDQVPKADLSRGLAEKHGFRIAQTIDEALTLGTDRLQVAGVLSIGEHGDYPFTPETKQHMYPRRRFFDAIAETFRRVGQVVPVFNDKHLSYRWSDAKHMVDLATKMKIPFMAGSSVPVTWRRPALALPLGCEIEGACAIGYGGYEAYGFHAIEALQCMVERRSGGETGIAAIRVLQGDEIQQARDRGEWSEELFAAALRTMPGTPAPDLKRLGKTAAFYQLEYRDGLKATVAMANGIAARFGFAARLRGQREPVATWFELQEERPYGHFGHLTRAIDHMIHTGQPTYPVERTLLTTGVLDAVMHSLADNGKRRETPELDVRYQPADWTFANREG